MPWWKLRVGMALAAVTVSACAGGGHHASPTTPTTALDVIARRYLSAAEAANARVAAARARLLQDSGHLSLVKADLAAVADAKRAFDRTLITVGIPPSMSVDLQRLLDADAALEHLLDRGAAAVTTAALGALDAQIVKAGDTAAQAASVVRHDLGLAPTPAPT
jgi:hypothetical protein